MPADWTGFMNFIHNLFASIKAKLFFSFALISIITLAAGVSGIIPFSQMERSLRQIGHANLQSLLRINQIKEAQSQIVAAERTLLIRQLADQNIRRENYQTIATAYQSAKEAATGFEELLPDERKIEEWQSFVRYWQIWSEKQNELQQILQKQEELLAQGIRGGRQFDRIANQAFELAFSELLDSRNQANQHLDALVELIRDSAVEAVDVSLRSAQSNIRWQMFFVVAAFVGSLILSLWLSIRISNPVLKSVSYITEVADGNLRQDVEPGLLTQQGEIGMLANAIQKLIESQRSEVEVFKSIADGDYTRTVPLRSNQDELGQAVGQMLDVTNETLAQVNLAVAQVTSGASASNNASQSLSQGAIETASS
ncbi:MAG: MCP four helix bundle domain-containing protein, partial [Planctomycetes bacterium]|nr:MCP four helix bundle domain-containing protein [Planctomycetota bacterium]